MSFTGLLRHRVTIERQVATTDPPTYTELGQPITAPQDVAEWPCLIQPMTAREVSLISQQGAVVADHRLFGPVADLREGDRLEEVGGAERAFEISAINDAGGQAHHLEVEALRVASRDLELPTS